jgi:hypothetical protein
MWVDHWVVFPRMNDFPCFAVLAVDRCSVFYTWFSVWGCYCRREGMKRTSMQIQVILAVVLSSSKHQLWISANKVTKLEERLLTPPVYSLRRTNGYDELPFAEPSRAEQVLQTVTLPIECYVTSKKIEELRIHNLKYRPPFNSASVGFCNRSTVML